MEGVSAVHILAHGAESDTSEGERFGILLKGVRGQDGDIVTGVRFASILRSLPDRSSLPSVIVAESVTGVPGATLALVDA